MLNGAGERQNYSGNVNSLLKFLNRSRQGWGGDSMIHSEHQSCSFLFTSEQTEHFEEKREEEPQVPSRSPS